MQLRLAGSGPPVLALRGPPAWNKRTAAVRNRQSRSDDKPLGAIDAAPFPSNRCRTDRTSSAVGETDAALSDGAEPVPLTRREETVMTYLQTRPVPPGVEGGSVLPTPDRERLRGALTKLVGQRDCRRLLDSAGETGVLRWPASHLAAASGVPERAAEKVVAARELRLDKSRGSFSRLTCPADVLRHLPAGYATWETETVLALALSAANQVIAVLLVAQGGGSAAVLVPRDVFTPLVRFRAAAFVLVHNHPAGDPTPSEADVRLTNRLAEAGRALAIEMVDHVIVASSGVTSLCETGLLPTDDELHNASNDDRDDRPTA